MEGHKTMPSNYCFSDDELIEISDKTAMQVVRDHLKSNVFKKEPARAQIMILKYFIDCAYSMKPEDVYDNCWQYIEQNIEELENGV